MLNIKTNCSNIFYKTGIRKIIPFRLVIAKYFCWVMLIKILRYNFSEDELTFIMPSFDLGDQVHVSSKNFG
jgi:hypothetical protein